MDQFADYWRRIELRERAYSIPAPCITWQRTEGFNQVERVIWERIRSAERILDYGSGDQSLKRKFVAAGYRGDYETFDISPEQATTYSDPLAIRDPFDAVLCLEVIEHLPLEGGLALRDRLVELVKPGGVLVLSTPNPGCVRSPFALDETHLHFYPLMDLITWAWTRGLSVEAWRVELLPPRVSVGLRLRLCVRRVLCYFLGADRADGLLIVAKRGDNSQT